MGTEKVSYIFELVDETTKNLTKIRKALKKSDTDFSNTGGSAQNFGKKMTGIGPTLVKGAALVGGVSLALIAVKKSFAFTTKSIFDFSGASAKLKAIVKPTTQEFKKLEAAALAYGSSTASTASQVLEAFTEQAKLGQKVNEILASGTAVLDLSAMAQIGLAEAATTTTQTLNQFELAASETTKVVDVMAKSFTISALDANKFAESMKFVGTIGSETNNSLEDVTATLGVLADRSIESSQAGTATRRVMLELADANSKVSKLIKATGEETETFIDKLKVLNKLQLDVSQTSELFGILSSTAATVMINNAGSIDVMAESLRGADGAAKEMAETMLESLPGLQTKMVSALEGMTLALKDGLTPAFEGVIKLITKMAQGTTKLLSAEANLKSLGLNELYSERSKHLERVNQLLDVTRQSTEEMAQSGIVYSNAFLQSKEKEITKIETFISKINEQIKAQEASIAGISSGASGKEFRSIDTEITTSKGPGIDIDAILNTDKLLKAKKKLDDRMIAIQQQTDLIFVDGRDKALMSLDQWYKAQQEIFKSNGELLYELGFEFRARELAINEEYDAIEMEKEQEKVDKKKELMEELAEKNKEMLDQRAADEAQFNKATKNAAIDSAGIVINTLFAMNKQRDSKDKKLKIDQIKSSKRSEAEKVKAIETIEKEAFEKNKRRSIIMALINGALGVTKTLATMGMPAAIPMLIVQGIATAASIALIASQKFGRGGVVQKEPGKSTVGDQHLIGVNPGEEVLTLEQRKQRDLNEDIVEQYKNKQAITSQIVIGDTSIIIQGDATEDIIQQIDQNLQDRNEELRSSLLTLQDSGRLSGLVF